jgi:ABC-2 type transport system permease protein
MRPEAVEFNRWLPFWSLLHREVLRFLNIAKQTVVAPVITASLYLVVFGVSLGERVALAPGISYIQFIVPGLVLMGVINNSFLSTAASIFMARYLGYLVDFLVAPISAAQFILAHTISAMFRGLLVGSVILGISLLFTSLPWPSPLQALGVMALASFLFSQLGVIAAIFSESFDGLSVYTNFLILPLIFLGGLFYPVSILPPFWQAVSMANPIFYLIDAMRHAALGIGEVSFSMAFAVPVVLAAALFSWAAFLITRSPRFRA